MTSKAILLGHTKDQDTSARCWLTRYFHSGASKGSWMSIWENGETYDMKYIILLKFSDNSGNAAEYVNAHKEWLNEGIEDGVFLMAGTLGSGMGGAIIAQDSSLEAIEIRVNADPFVKAQVVRAEILEFALSVAAKDLQFLIPRDAA